jgi:hypothetical protein
MSVSNHALHLDFPEYKHSVQELRNTDEDFREQSDHYEKLDKTIRGLESREVPMDDEHFNELKKERAHLKDTLYHKLTAHGGG